MNEALAYSFLVAASFFVYRLFTVGLFTRKGLPLPPGPRSYPVIGQLLSMPGSSEQHAFLEMGRKLGSDIFSLSFFGTTIVVLNSAEAATELLEKRANVYSGRADVPMISSPSLMNLQDFVLFMNPTERWKRYRKMLHSFLSKQAITSFRAPQQYQSRLLLQRLLHVSKDLDSSAQVESELYRTIASTVLDSVYGYQLETVGDPFVVNTNVFIENLTKAVVPSNFLVNTVPWLAYVPEWLPGMSWKKKAREWGVQKSHAIDSIYNWAKERVVAGVDDRSIVASTLKEVKRLGWDENASDEFTKNLAIATYGVATDATINTLMVFVLAMVLFPNVQSRAQEEIDTVIGSGRLPTAEDRPNLPYLERLMSEVWRWQPPAPIAIPHACTREDEYCGYRIPKDAIVIGNVFAMSRDERIYDDAEVFNPDRFLDPTVPAAPAFGWGHRLCSGIHFGQATAFIIIASILATFNITKHKDKSGNSIVPTTEGANNAMIYRPKTFACEFRPRSELHIDLIRSGA